MFYKINFYISIALVLQCSLILSTKINKEEILLDAVSKKNVNLVIELLNQNTNLFIRADKGLTPLQLAIIAPNSPTIKKTKFISKNNDNDPAITLGEESKKKQIIQALIDKNKSNSPERIDLYINYKNYLDLNALYYAVKNNDITSTEILLASDANVNHIYNNKLADSKITYPLVTPLMIACLNESKSLVKLLLKHNANVYQSFTNNYLIYNSRGLYNESGNYNALIIAYNTNNLEIFNTILESGISYQEIKNNLDYFLKYPKNQILDIVNILRLMDNLDNLNKALELAHQKGLLNTVLKFIKKEQYLLDRISNNISNLPKSKFLDILESYIIINKRYNQIKKYSCIN